MFFREILSENRLEREREKKREEWRERRGEMRLRNERDITGTER